MFLVNGEIKLLIHKTLAEESVIIRVMVKDHKLIAVVLKSGYELVIMRNDLGGYGLARKPLLQGGNDVIDGERCT